MLNTTIVKDETISFVYIITLKKNNSRALAAYINVHKSLKRTHNRSVQN